MGAEARARRERERLIDSYGLDARMPGEALELALAVVRAFDRSPGPAGVADGLRAIHRRYDELAARLPVAHVAGRVRLRLACAPRCDHCCATPVTLIAAEALLLAQHLRERSTQGEREALLARIELHERTVADPDAAWPMCPLNVDGLCSAYEVRPFNCRKFHSFDRGACARYFAGDGPPGSDEPIPRDVTRDGGVFWDGLDAGSRALHIDTRDLHLVPALRLALTGEAVCERLLAGEHVFAGAEYEP